MLSLSGALDLPVNAAFGSLNNAGPASRSQPRPRAPYSVQRLRLGQVEPQDIPGRDPAAGINVLVSLNPDSSLDVHVAYRREMQSDELSSFLNNQDMREHASYRVFAPLEAIFRWRFPNFVNNRRDYFIPFNRVREAGTGAFIVSEWNVSHLIIPLNFR